MAHTHTHTHTHTVYLRESPIDRPVPGQPWPPARVVQGLDLVTDEPPTRVVDDAVVRQVQGVTTLLTGVRVVPHYPKWLVGWRQSLRAFGSLRCSTGGWTEGGSGAEGGQGDDPRE